LLAPLKLALEFQHFDPQTHQRLALVVGAVGLLAGEVVDLEVKARVFLTAMPRMDIGHDDSDQSPDLESTKSKPTTLLVARKVAASFERTICPLLSSALKIGLTGVLSSKTILSNF